MGKGAETGDVVVEGDVDLNSLSNQILEVLELLELVLALNVLGVGNHHASHETTKRSDTVALTNTKNGSINVSSTSLQSTVRVGNGTASVVVEVSFNVAAHNTSEHTDKFVNLARGSAANGVGNTNTVHTNLVDGGVDGEEINEVGTEGVLAGESNFDTLRLDEFNDFNGGVLDVGHVLAMGVLTEI